MRKKSNDYEFNYDSYVKDKEETRIEDANDTKVSKLSQDDKKNIIVSGILLLVLVIGVGGYFLYQNNMLSGIGISKNEKSIDSTNPADMNENPRKSEDDPPKPNTSPDKNGNKNTNTNTKIPTTNQIPNPNNTPKTTEKNVPKEDNKSNTNVDVNKENNNSQNQGTITKEDEKGTKTTEVPKTSPTTTNVPKTSPTTAKKEETTTNSTPQTTKAPSNNQGNTNTNPSQGNSGNQNNTGNTGNNQNANSGSNGTENKGSGNDDGEQMGGSLDASNKLYTFVGIPSINYSIKKIHFIKLSKDEMNTRYNASAYKDPITWSNAGVLKMWLENDTFYIASDKRIYLKNTARGTQRNYGYDGTPAVGRPQYVWCDLFPNVEKFNFENVNTSLITDMEGMFQRCSKLKTIDNLNRFNTKNVTNMSFMFYDCPLLEKIDLSSFDTSKVTDMTSMFSHSQKLKTIYVSSKWTTDAVKDSHLMFYNSSLVGGAGTKFNYSKTDKTYARIDKVETPGYLTLK